MKNLANAQNISRKNAKSYSNNPVALNLRAMNMLYESIVKRGSLMVVPSGLADSLNVPNLLGLTGAGADLTASLRDEREGKSADAAES